MNDNTKAETALDQLTQRGIHSRSEACAHLRTLLPDLFSAHPVGDYIALLDATQEGKSMYALAPEVSQLRESIIGKWGKACLEVYHRVALLTLIDEFPVRAKKFNYPDSIIAQFRLNFSRIEGKVMTGPAGTYPDDGDTFLKDFAICLQSAFPGGGAWVVDHQGGFTRSVMFKGGVAQFFKLAGMYLFVTRGHRPLYGLHIHNDLTEGHTMTERMACHLRLTEMLERHPEIRGICGASWLTDPAIPKISPRLHWVREIPEANGCRYYRVATDINGGALTRSKTRRQLFEQGEYIPTSYLNIWPRKRMIAWGRRVRQERSQGALIDKHALHNA